jgi:hypothetical protein
MLSFPHYYSITDILLTTQLVKMKKLTGTGKRPYFVTKAKDIDRLINEKVATRHIDDAELEDGNHSNTSDHECGTPGQDEGAKVSTVIARNGHSEVPEARRTRGQQTAELVGKIATALDPETQCARDDKRANRSFQNTQIFALNQQLRDSQQLNDSLRSQINQLCDCLYKVERLHDCLDMELNFERCIVGMAVVSAGLEPQDRKHNPVHGKVRSTINYPEGGSCTAWITDGSSASDCDDEKENIKPSLFMHHCPSLPTQTYKPQQRKHVTSPPCPPTQAGTPAMATSGTPLTSQPSVEI